MRKIEQQMIHAIRERKDFSSGNTKVVHSESGKYFQVYLHGNMIANGCHDSGTIAVFDCGYRSNTTKSRLNTILKEFVPGYWVTQRDFVWYLNGSQKWTGQATFKSGSLAS